MEAITKSLHFLQPDPQTGAISTPIYQTSTFVQQAPGVNQGFDYSRSNNPTRQALEDLAAHLEGGHSGYAFGSGLAAVDAVIKLLSAGDEIIAVDDIYGGSFRCFTHIYKKFGINVKYVDTTSVENVADAISPATKLVWLETPTNPTLKISDIQKICKVAHAKDCLVVADNTFASPVLQQPIKLGADLIIHSATKYLGGHSDLIAGLVICKNQELGEKIKFIQNATGAVLGPQDSWLVIRGIETLHLRVNAQADSAYEIAHWLQAHPQVDLVYYPGLKNHPNHDIAKEQQSKFGSIISFSLKEDKEELAVDVVQKTKLFKLAESLGGIKSLLCVPALMTHKSTPRETRLNAGIKDSLIRLSVGTEATQDLIHDLDQALAATFKSKIKQTEEELAV
ncbi:trans-sulfuration enzyme family protein [Owenweeksia hongkongensis]|uniref:trans-sulfuration enzyme family protein n=1 Tax=Owenweeksia hongkongensis TaxID=253245 RepID=UPI003A8FF426